MAEPTKFHHETTIVTASDMKTIPPKHNLEANDRRIKQKTRNNHHETEARKVTNN
jgi:hypothetical protein